MVQIFCGFVEKLLALCHCCTYIYELLALLPGLQDVDILGIILFEKCITLLSDLHSGIFLNLLVAREPSKLCLHILCEIHRINVPEILRI